MNAPVHQYVNLEALPSDLRAELVDKGLTGGEVVTCKPRGGSVEVLAVRTAGRDEVPVSPYLADRLVQAVGDKVGNFQIPEFDPDQYPMHRGQKPPEARPQPTDFASEPAYYSALVQWEKRNGLAPGQRPRGV